MKLKKDDWLYVLPDDVVEIRNAMLHAEFYYEAVRQVKPQEIRDWHEAVKKKTGFHPRGKSIYVALEHDEFGQKLLVFPAPEQDATLDLTVMKFAQL